MSSTLKSQLEWGSRAKACVHSSLYISTHLFTSWTQNTKHFVRQVKDTEYVYIMGYLWYHNPPGHIGELYKRQLSFLASKVYMICEFCMSVWGEICFLLSLIYSACGALTFFILPSDVELFPTFPKLRKWYSVKGYNKTVTPAQDSRASGGHCKPGLQKTKEEREGRRHR